MQQPGNCPIHWMNHPDLHLRLCHKQPATMRIVCLRLRDPASPASCLEGQSTYHLRQQSGDSGHHALQGKPTLKRTVRTIPPLPLRKNNLPEKYKDVWVEEPLLVVPSTGLPVPGIFGKAARL